MHSDDDTLYCSGALPGENEVSITKLTALIIKLYCKFSGTVCPKYIEAAAENGSYAFVMPYAFQNMQAHIEPADKAKDNKLMRIH